MVRFSRLSLLAAKSAPQRRRPTAADLGVRLPRSGTTAYLEFLSSFRQINGFLKFLLYVVSASEHSAQVAHDALVDVEHDPVNRAQMIEDWKKRRGPVSHLAEHRQFLLEVILVRHVENYLNYLSSLLREIFIARPEALRSSEKIDLETVLTHNSINDLVRTVTERKVESLSYSSFSDLAEYFQDKFHLALTTEGHRAVLVDAIETRNISVHNRCIINRRYMARVNVEASQLGRVRELVIDTVEAAARAMLHSVLSSEKEARKRLGVSGHRKHHPQRGK